MILGTWLKCLLSKTLISRVISDDKTKYRGGALVYKLSFGSNRNFIKKIRDVQDD